MSNVVKSLLTKLPVGASVRTLRNAYEQLPWKPLQPQLRWLYRRYKEAQRGQRVVETIDGITWDLDLNEHIDSGIYNRGSFELATTDALERLVQDGYTVLDIGANVGAHTLPMACKVGAGGRVLAFEPMSWAREKLGRNLALNPALSDRVSVHPIALSDDNRLETVTFSCSWPLSGADEDELHPFHRGKSATEEVQLARLDDFVVEHGIEKVDFVKLDVDGFELKVVRGAAETIARHKPTFIMELGVYSVAEVGDDVNDLVQAFLDNGYTFYREQDLEPFESTEAMLASVPERATINVVVSARGV